MILCNLYTLYALVININMDELPSYVSDKEQINNISVLHVCRTGKKEQFYTLYHEGVIKREFGTNGFCDFRQNLAHSLTDALEKATDTFNQLVESNFWDAVSIQYHETPRMKYNKWNAFGAEFKTAKSGKVMWAHATPAFWDFWKAEKQTIKDAGFWVKKMDSGWMIFCRQEAKYDYS